jgi:hypothetical protein
MLGGTRAMANPPPPAPVSFPRIPDEVNGSMFNNETLLPSQSSCAYFWPFLWIH